MALYQRQLDDQYNRWIQLKELGAHVKKILTPNTMDMEVNWRTEHLIFCNFIALNDNGKKVVWC